MEDVVMGMKDELNKLANDNQYKIEEAKKRVYEKTKKDYNEIFLPQLKQHALDGLYWCYLACKRRDNEYIEYLVEILEKDGFKVENNKGFMTISWN